MLHVLVLMEGSLQNFIKNRNIEDESILHFVSLEEKFDMIKKSHSALNHTGRDKIQKELNNEHTTMTFNAINLLNSKCEECQVRRKNLTNGVVIKLLLPKECNSLEQVDPIDIQSTPDGDFKFNMIFEF